MRRRLDTKPRRHHHHHHDHDHDNHDNHDLIIMNEEDKRTCPLAMKKRYNWSASNCDYSRRPTSFIFTRFDVGKRSLIIWALAWRSLRDPSLHNQLPKGTTAAPTVHICLGTVGISAFLREFQLSDRLIMRMDRPLVASKSTYVRAHGTLGVGGGLYRLLRRQV